MLGSKAYYNRSIEKLTTLVGYLFDEIYVQRYKSDGSPDKVIKVPINFAPNMPYLVREEDNPDLQRPINQTLPTISYDLKSIEKDDSRQLSPLNVYQAPLIDSNGVATGDTTSFMQPMPYDFTYEVYVKTNRQSDGFQILEQIVPLFRNHINITANLVDGINYPLDVNVWLDAPIVREDNYDGSMNKLRAIIWTFTLKVNGWIFGPVDTGPGAGNKKVIKKVIVDLHASMAEPGVRISRVTVQPGLTSSGQPTTDPSQSIDYKLINVTDPYGICVTLEDFNDGKHFDPTSGNDIE